MYETDGRGAGAGVLGLLNPAPYVTFGAGAGGVPKVNGFGVVAGAGAGLACGTGGAAAAGLATGAGAGARST